MEQDVNVDTGGGTTDIYISRQQRDRSPQQRDANTVVPAVLLPQTAAMRPVVDDGGHQD